MIEGSTGRYGKDSIKREGSRGFGNGGWSPWIKNSVVK